MIIKSQRVATSASRQRLADHLFRGHENSSIAILRGGERDLYDLFHDARRHGARFGVRHWIIAPLETTSREQLLRVVELLASEFQFNSSQAIIIEHTKERATSSAFDKHWHLCLGEVNTETGKVMSSSHDRAKHEYIARLTEAEFGHALQLGAHLRSVLARLREEGNNALADALNAAFPDRDGERKPGEAFTQGSHQMLKRAGIDLPAIRAAVKAAWQTSADLKAMRDTLREQGLSLAAGDKDGEWIVNTADGRFVGSLRRLAGAKKSEIRQRLEIVGDITIEHEPEHRPDDPGRHTHASPGRVGANVGGVVVDNTAGRSGEVNPRHDAGSIDRYSGRHCEASGERDSAAHPAVRSDIGPGFAGGAERSRLVVQKLRELSVSLRSVAKRAADLAISPMDRQDGYLAAAERSARAQLQQAESDVTNGDEAVQAQANRAKRDQAEAAQNAKRIAALKAQLQLLEHRHRHLRFLPSWLKTGYTGEKARLQTQIAELDRNSSLFQLRANRSQRMLEMAKAQESKRKTSALSRLADECAKQRSILMATSMARRLRALPGFAWLPAATLLDLATRLNRFRTSGFEVSHEDSDFRFRAPR